MTNIYRANEAAAFIHDFMCNNKEFCGYTQGHDRWGQNLGKKVTLEYKGIKFNINAGDYDCSSSVVYAWQKALEPTKYKGVLGFEGYDQHNIWKSWYTGNMLELFLESGLFYRENLSYIAKPGDIYLNETSHVAMCQCQNPDTLSEFLINEKGGIIGGEKGDQTGNESVVRPYYDFPWDLILNYNGKADFDMSISKEDIEKIWSFNINGVQARDRLHGTDMAANAAKNALLIPSDASGRNKMSNVPDRLAWLGRRMDELETQVDSANKGVTQVLKELVYIEGIINELKKQVGK